MAAVYQIFMRGQSFGVERNYLVILNGHSRSLFLYLRLFKTFDSKQMLQFQFGDDWI